jgi:photosystem II stability/assembly factor-like uncharacterized protein
MPTLILATMLAFSLGPMGPDAPAREPQLAVKESTVALTFGAGSSVYFSASKDGGRTFGPPVKVSQQTVLPLNRHRGPRIAIAGNTIVISAVAGNTLSQAQHGHGLPTDGDLLVWHSRDGGKSWSKASVVNDVPGAPTEGLHTLAAGANGQLFAAWLDHRGGNGTKLYGARSLDGGSTWSRNVLIYKSPDGSICECCHPSAAIDSDGQIEVMFRNWLSGSRDLYLTRSHDGLTFSQPERLGKGTWQLNACPMDGGGLAISDGRTFTAWRRGEEVFLAEPGREEMRLGTGKDVALAVGGKIVRVAWTNGTKIELWTAGKSTVLSNTGGFAALAGLTDGSAVAAWEENGAIVTRRLAARETH